MNRNGHLYVYSNGHEYVIKDIGEVLACELIDEFRAFHNDDLDVAEEDLPEDYDYLISLRYSSVDALVWNAA